MTLKPLDDINQEESNFLDITALQEEEIYTKVALVVDTGSGLTKSNSGFVKFYLKDVNGNLVTARLFDVENFAFSGIKLAAFKNKPVQMRFRTNLYNGSLSLIIDGTYGIREWEGPFDRSRFVGKYDVNEDAAVAIITKFSSQKDWKFPIDYRTGTFLALGQGKVGAFAKLFEMSLMQLLAYENLTGIEPEKLFDVFLVTMEIYFRVLTAREKFGFLGDVKVFDIVNGINSMKFDQELKPLVLDAVRPFANLGKPRHLYSHLIYKTVIQVERCMELVLINNRLIVGASSTNGGEVLLKF